VTRLRKIEATRWNGRQKEDIDSSPAKKRGARAVAAGKEFWDIEGETGGQQLPYRRNCKHGGELQTHNRSCGEEGTLTNPGGIHIDSAEKKRMSVGLKLGG